MKKAEKERVETEAREERERENAARLEKRKKEQELREKEEAKRREERERLEKERIEAEVREKEDTRRRERRERARKQRALELSKTPLEAIDMLREDIIESTQNENTTFDSVKSSLLYILNGILDHPEETSWRRLRKSNEKLNRDILRHRGARIFLLSCGFRERILHLNAREVLSREIRAYYEMTAPRELRERGGRVDVEKLATHYERNPSELWRRLTKKYGHGRPKDVDKKFKDGDWYLILEEPDAETDTEKWTRWYNRLKEARSLLVDGNGGLDDG